LTTAPTMPTTRMMRTMMRKVMRLLIERNECS
jgi:hypothetical protein